jgi:outer membrane protein assembly factor BamC
MKSFRLSVLAATVVGLSVLAGCGATKGPDYRSQGQNTKIRSLEVPPDLTSPIADDRFLVPDAKATTFSQYSRERAGGSAQPVSSGGSGVLPKFENARIERQGEQRWLIVKGSPDRLWPVIKEFWQETGFVLRRETPESGIMETEWAENRSKIPEDIIRRTIGRAVDGLYATGERDKFRTRLEAGAEPGTTEIFVSHRGIEEVYTNPDKNSTGWQFRPSDRSLEAEMLGRMMVKLGFANDKATAVAGAVSAPVAAARATYNKDKDNVVKVNDAFDRAWRRVGLALDRSGFTVEDRDRSKGVFFVRYIDPEFDAKSGEKKGFLDRLAFWRKDAPSEQQQFRVKVTEAAGSTTDVEVQNKDGKLETSPTAKRILNLLFEQLR